MDTQRGDGAYLKIYKARYRAERGFAKEIVAKVVKGTNEVISNSQINHVHF